MKNKIFIIAIALLGIFAVSCNKDNKNTQKNRVRGGNETVDIHIANTRANSKYLSAVEISKKTAWMISYEVGAEESRDTIFIMFSDAQRDTINGVLKMWATDIITYNPFTEKYKLKNYKPSNFINRRNIRAVDSLNNVIAYIPNQTLIDAKAKIEKLFEEKKYDEIYDAFQTAYTAIPITTEEYNELLKNNKQ